MLLSSNYDGKKSLKRRGIATEVIIDDIKKGTDLVVDKANNVLRIKNGKGRHVALTRFAVVGSVKLNMFFINGGMVVELKRGMILADLGNNKFAKVMKSGVEYVEIDFNSIDKNTIKWVTSEDLLNNAKVLIGHKYKLTDDMEKDLYVHNLAYNLLIDEGSNNKNGWGLTIKFVNFFTDLGLDKFDFAIGNYVHVVEKVKRPKISEYKTQEDDNIEDGIIDRLVSDATDFDD